MTVGLNDLAQEAHHIALQNGFYGKDSIPTFGDLIALLHSEASEAFEEYRHGHSYTEVYYNPGSDKPEGIPVELADLLIRILDIAAFYAIDLEHVHRLKTEYNRTRPFRHGNKKV